MAKKYTEDQKFEIMLKEQEEFRNNLDVYKKGLELLKLTLSDINNSLRKKGLGIVYTTDRIKSENSFLEKVHRKIDSSEPFNTKSAHDIIGFRVILRNLEDVRAYVNSIHNNPLIKVVNEKNYIDDPKESGYKSIHLIVEIPVDTIMGKKKVHAEIQVRTALMDVFAREEHKLNYKGDCSAESREELFELSLALTNCESSFENALKGTMVKPEEPKKDEVEKFNKVLPYFEKAQKKLQLKIDDLKDNYPNRDDIAFTSDRIKPVTSIKRKLKKRKLSYTPFNIRTKITDVVGFKIVVMTRKELDSLLTYIKKSKIFDIIDEKNYVKTPKESGYKGYHLKVKENVLGPNGQVEIVSEIQLQTMLMAAWSANEDVFYLDKNLNNNSIKYNLSVVSKNLYTVAERLDRLKEKELELKKSKLIALKNKAYMNRCNHERNFIKELEEYKKNKKNPSKGSLKLVNVKEKKGED